MRLGSIDLINSDRLLITIFSDTGIENERRQEIPHDLLPISDDLKQRCQRWLDDIAQSEDETWPNQTAGLSEAGYAIACYLKNELPAITVYYLDYRKYNDLYYKKYIERQQGRSYVVELSDYMVDITKNTAEQYVITHEI